jgi:hypothetical protein
LSGPFVRARSSHIRSFTVGSSFTEHPFWVQPKTGLMVELIYYNTKLCGELACGFHLLSEVCVDELLEVAVEYALGVGGFCAGAHVFDLGIRV